MKARRFRTQVANRSFTNILNMFLSLLLIISILIPLVYIILFVGWAEKGGKPASSPIKNDNLMKAYDVLNDDVSKRENTVLISGTIFVTAALLLLGQSATNGVQRTPLILGSWVIYSIWLFFFQLGSVRLSTVTYERLSWIEENADKPFAAHSYLKNYRIKSRRWVWFILLNALLLIGNLFLHSWLSMAVDSFFMLVAIAWDFVSD